jgi:hypothetical protein
MKAPALPSAVVVVVVVVVVFRTFEIEFFTVSCFVFMMFVVVTGWLSSALAEPVATSASPTVPIAIRVVARRRSGSDGVSMWVRVFMGRMLDHGDVSA